MLILTPLAWTVQAAVMSRKDAVEYFILICSGYCIVLLDCSRVLRQSDIYAESCRQQVEK